MDEKIGWQKLVFATAKIYRQKYVNKYARFIHWKKLKSWM